MKKTITIIYLTAFMPMISFSQNSNDIYGNSKAKATYENKDTTYAAGFNDGFYKYDGYKGIATGTFVTSLLSPILGLAPAIGGSSGNPRVDFFTMPSSDQYKYGYLAGAKSRRNKKIWGNWVFGSVISIGITAIIISTMKSKAESESGYQIPQF